jgi:hypothetical protein
MLALSGCQNHPVDCAAGFAWDDCLPGTKGYEKKIAIQGAMKDKCASYGFRKGTDAYAQCMMTLDQNRKNRIAMGMAATGTYHPMPVYQMAHPVTTNCNTFGGTTSCSSYKKMVAEP